jgi:Helix-turn-helix domain
METERIALSQRERDRLGVLQEVKRKQLTQMEAARRLKLSDRHIRRLLFRLREHGDRAVIHGLRGRRSNRRLTARLEQKILRRVRQPCGLRTHIGCRALGPGGIASEPRNAAQVDGEDQLMVPPRATSKDHPCVAGAARMFRGAGDAG